jgi:hypothetical protein
MFHGKRASTNLQH